MGPGKYLSIFQDWKVFLKDIEELRNQMGRSNNLKILNVHYES